MTATTEDTSPAPVAPAPAQPSSTDHASLAFRAVKEFGIPTIFALIGLVAAYYVYDRSEQRLDKQQAAFLATIKEDRKELRDGFKEAVQPLVTVVERQNTVLEQQKSILIELKATMEAHRERDDRREERPERPERHR